MKTGAKLFVLIVLFASIVQVSFACLAGPASDGRSPAGRGHAGLSHAGLSGDRSADGRRGITAEDYLDFKFVSDPHISPDGKLVAYVVTRIDRKQNRRHSAIWMAHIDGSGQPWVFTTSAESSSSPRWSPDGSQLAFLSNRPTPGASANEPATAGNQVFILSMSGGEARQLTHLKNGVSSFSWSPDGTRMALLGRSGPSDLRGDAKPASDVRHYSHASYKFNDTGWFDDRHGHIWIADAKTGSEKQITSGDDWNDQDPQWSPDSSKIAFVSDRTGRAFDDSYNTDVWVIPAEGGSLTKISDHEGPDSSPRWSPDGKTIAYLGSVKEADQQRIWLAPSAGGAASVMVSPELDLIATRLEWGEADRALYFVSGTKAETHLFRLDRASGQARPVTAGERAVGNVDMNEKSGKMVFTSNDFKHLDSLCVADISGSGERKLADPNTELWGQLQLQDVERLPFKGADGWDEDGFLVRPIGWQEGKSYPLILSIHGGPEGMYGVDWYHEFQVYAARGWAVFFCNPRGSTGYGEKFRTGIRNEWGGKDYIDIMNGLEAALAKYPWIDRNRLGVTGGSYGGFMTNWILGHTNIFKAAVTLRSLSNFISDEGTRDGQYGHRIDFDGDVFEKFDTYWDRSPLKYAKNVKTPTLIMHSDNDYRVPLEQGEQWFRALRHFGVTTEMVIFPRENHNLTRTGEPKHLVESLNWQIYWFSRFIDGNASAVPPDGAGVTGKGTTEKAM
jgi:dipeptidyl aminopeptidase/acylaminoacyl peptidase